MTCVSDLLLVICSPHWGLSWFVCASSLRGTVVASQASWARPCRWRETVANADGGAADTPADFVYDGSQYAHTMGSKKMGAGEPNGVVDVQCRYSGKRSSSHAMLNETTLNGKSATFIRSTAVHELGHYIGLRHSTVTPSIMNSTGNFYGYGIQKQDDECGVQDIYTHVDYPLVCNY